jgi:pyruvate, orthophosphate dikinase
MGKCCVVGAQALTIDEAAGECRAGDRLVRAGDWITVDGTTGEVLLGVVPTVEPTLGDEFHRIMAWADERRRDLGVRANADTPDDARQARSSARKASDCAAPSTCSSRASASRSCAR